MISSMNKVVGKCERVRSGSNSSVNCVSLCQISFITSHPAQKPPQLPRYLEFTPKMVSLLASSLTSCSSPGLDILSSLVRTSFSRKHRAASVAVVVVATSSKDESCQKPTKFVTFLGKGGSGKTTASVFAAQVIKTTILLIPFLLHSWNL